MTLTELNSVVPEVKFPFIFCIGILIISHNVITRAAQYWKKLTALYFFPLILNISGKYYLALFKEKYNMLKIWMQAEKSPL